VATPVLVAVIAAFASALGAGLSLLAARSARRGADTIDRRRHLVAALDDDRATFNAAFTQFMATLRDTDPANTSAAHLSADVLASHPRSTPELITAVNSMMDRLSPTSPLWGTHHGDGSFVSTAAIRERVREVNASIAADYAAALADLGKRR